MKGGHYQPKKGDTERTEKKPGFYGARNLLTESGGGFESKGRGKKKEKKKRHWEKTEPR